MHLKLHIIAFIGLVASFFAASCSLKGNPPETANIVDIRINHFRQTAVGEGPYLVYLIQEDEKIGTEDWQYLYESIEGFNYEQGYIYDLKAKKTIVENPPADGSSLKYELVSVISKDRVPEEESFAIKLKAYDYNFVVNDGNDFMLLYEYVIDCNSLCESLSESLASNDQVTANFIHGPGESLILQSFE